MSEQLVRLRVDDWSHPRFAQVQGDKVLFEVMWHGCACPTCFARLSMVLGRMEESDVKWSMVNTQVPRREGLSSVLVVEPEVMPERLDTFLGELTGLQIREVA